MPGCRVKIRGAAHGATANDPRRKKIWLLCLLVAGATPCPACATATGNLAAGMEPGTWAVLESDGFDDGAVLRVANGSPFDYTDEAVRDPVTKRWFFLGAAHGGTENNAAFLQYDAQENRWSRLPLRNFQQYPITHAYDMLAFDPQAGTLFYRRYNRSELYAFDTRGAGSDRRLLQSHPIWNGNTICGLAYFPEMDALIIYQGTWGHVRRYDFRSDQLSTLGQVDSSGVYHVFARYDPVHKVVLFGGGNRSNAYRSRDLWKLDAAGRITKLSDCPVWLGITAAVQVVEPATGKLLVFSRSKTFYEYDVDADQWRQLDASGVPFLSGYEGHRVVAVPIPEYGVVMFVVHPRSGPSRVWLYKHAVADTTPPSAPTGLYAAADGDGKVDLRDLLIAVNSFGLSQGEIGFDPART